MCACIADRREFLRIGQAVGMGFLIMGVIGYVVKLSESLPRPEERHAWYGIQEISGTERGECVRGEEDEHRREC